MYVYCIYPAISKSPKHLPNCLKITETIKEVKWTSVLLDHGTNSNKALLVPDSHRKTERNGNSINADVTDITIENN
jgi:hypothetical protein